MAVNACAKTRKVNNPYEVYRIPGTEWEWRVLKKYQTPERERTNPHATWYCAVKSEFTMGGYDLGDVYVHDVVYHAVKMPEEEMAMHVEANPW